MTEIPNPESERLVLFGIMIVFGFLIVGCALVEAWGPTCFWSAVLILAIAINTLMARAEISGRQYQLLASAAGEDPVTAETLQTLRKGRNLHVSVSQYNRIGKAHNIRMDGRRRADAVRRMQMMDHEAKKKS